MVVHLCADEIHILQPGLSVNLQALIVLGKKTEPLPHQETVMRVSTTIATIALPPKKALIVSSTVNPSRRSRFLWIANQEGAAGAAVVVGSLMLSVTNTPRAARIVKRRAVTIP